MHNRFSLLRFVSPQSAILVAALFLGLSFPGEAQQGRKIPNISVLEPGFSPAKSTTSLCRDWFRRGLRELGYTEGQNVAIEYRFADGQLQLLPKLAAELLRLDPDVIWTHSITAAQAAKRATAAVPIVVGVALDFAQHGLVTSLAKPGGNVTGLEHDPANPAHAGVPQNITAQARVLRVEVHRVEANGPEDFDRA